MTNESTNEQTTHSLHPSHEGHSRHLHTSLLKLYDSNVSGPELDALISVTYHPNVVFEDPIVKTKGLDDFRSQFVALRQLFRSSRIVEHTFLFSENDSIAMMDAVVEYRLPLGLFAIQLRQVSKLSVDCYTADCWKVLHHVDLWSLESLVTSIPLIGWIYGIWRALFVGVILSKVLQQVQPKFKRE